VLILAAIIAAVVVPVGFALSREADVMPTRQTNGVALAASTVATPAVVIPIATDPALFLPAVPEGAKLIFVGTVLFGLAAAMRRVH
jgi:hypothetical protein